METNSQWILYVKTSCPWCILAIRYMRKRGYDFKEVNVSRDAEAYRQMQLLSGQRLTPTLAIGDGLILPDFDTEQLEKFLRANNLWRE